MRVRCVGAEETHFERDDEAVWRPFVDHGFQDLGHLVHLDQQTALAGLDLVLRLRVGPSVVKHEIHDAPWEGEEGRKSLNHAPSSGAGGKSR